LILVDVDQHHVIARKRQNLDNAGAHLAGADDADPADLACRCWTVLMCHDLAFLPGRLSPFS
jgi:hypothetical protein